MKNLTCISCPVGCSLSVEEGAVGADGFPELTITGNRCPRGVVYAREEVRAPKRTVTATCEIEDNSGKRGPYAPRRAPVKTSAPCPRERINELLAEVYKLKVTLPVKAGSRLIKDWKGLGIDIVAVRNIE